MHPTSKFSPMARAAGVASPFWDEALRAGVHGLVVQKTGPSASLTIDDRELTNMSSYSYLGLDEHPAIVEGAVRQLSDSRLINTSLSRVRMRLGVLDEAEQRLSRLFGADTATVTSCAAAAWAMLPLMASGLLSEGTRPVMVFDRFSHYCLQSMRALCAVETEVRTIGHNDIEKLEQICRENPCVVYVADSVYSTGGTIAPMQELMSLQDRYGLYLFLDEAHGTSVIGKNGRGYALETMGQINDRTILVTSLNKGFGVSGGAIMFGPRDNQLRHGGPFIFSQHVNTPTLGAIIASCKIHESPELNQLQMQLKTTIKTFDRLLPLPHANPNTPIRFVPIGDEIETIHQSRLLMDSGYYVEPDFFPIVMWGQAGLRIRLRANMTSPEIEQFCAALSEHLRKSGIPIKPSE